MNKKLNNKTLTIEQFIDDTTIDFEKKLNEILKDKKIIELLKTGKHLRPIMAHISFKVCTKGYETDKEYQKALEGMVCIELAHTASLIFDDVIDQDKERRGQTAFYIKEGIPNALLIGNKMIAIGNEIALKQGKKMAKLFVKTWKECLDGEIKEVNFNNKTDKKKLNEKLKSDFIREYNRIINMKTASLFSASCKSGAIEARSTVQVSTILGEYGREIGLAYQLADDLVDLKNGEMISSVLIPLLVKSGNKNIDTHSFDMDSILRLTKKNIAKVEQIYIKEIKNHLDRAEKLSKSEKLPDSVYKDILKHLPKYIINNMLKTTKLEI